MADHGSGKINKYAGIVKRSNTGDCKSSGSAFGGSNPSPCTIEIIFKDSCPRSLFVCSLDGEIPSESIKTYN